MYHLVPADTPRRNTSAAGAGFRRIRSGGESTADLVRTSHARPGTSAATLYPAIDRHERSSSFQLHRRRHVRVHVRREQRHGPDVVQVRHRLDRAQRMRYSRPWRRVRGTCTSTPQLTPQRNGPAIASRRSGHARKAPGGSRHNRRRCRGAHHRYRYQTPALRPVESSLRSPSARSRARSCRPSALDASCHHSSSTASVCCWSLSAMAARGGPRSSCRPGSRAEPKATAAQSQAARTPMAARIHTGDRPAVSRRGAYTSEFQ